MSVVADAGGQPPMDVARRGTRLRRELLRPAPLFGVAVLGLVLLAALFPSVLAPYDPLAQNIPNRLSGPSSQHWLGTDAFGRDVLSRIIHGARVGLLVAVPAVAIGVVFGVGLGMLAGYRGGRLDAILVLLFDAVIAFPGLLVVLLVIALLGPSVTNLILILGLSSAAPWARVGRGMVLALRAQPFVESQVSQGATTAYILRVHLVPNMVGPLAVMIALEIPSIIAAEAGLSLLGLGIPPPLPSWGSILAAGMGHVLTAPGEVIFASLALALTTLAVMLVGEALRTVADPKSLGSGMTHHV
jgi:peptide/nickel transport system permease protein